MCQQTYYSHHNKYYKVDQSLQKSQTIAWVKRRSLARGSWTIAGRIMNTVKTAVRRTKRTNDVVMHAFIIKPYSARVCVYVNSYGISWKRVATVR